MRSTDLGEKWARVYTAPMEFRAAVLLPQSNTLVAHDERGTILRSTDDGRTWTEALAGNGRTDFAPPLVLPAKDTVVLAGEFGSILRSEDAGAHS